LIDVNAIHNDYASVLEQCG